MPTYVRADESVTDLVTEVMQAHHQDLAAEGVTVATLMARGKRDKDGVLVGVAITIGGYQCAGCLRITSLKQRALGMADAVMLLDGDRWDGWKRERQVALVDHELTHLQLVDGDEGFETDDLGRPKLRARRHDREFGWFDDVAARHGEHSFEWEQFRDFEASCLTRTGRQLWLPFDERSGGAPDGAADATATDDPELAEAMRIMRRAADAAGVKVVDVQADTADRITVERIKTASRRASRNGRKTPGGRL